VHELDVILHLQLTQSKRLSSQCDALTVSELSASTRSDASVDSNTEYKTRKWGKSALDYNHIYTHAIRHV